MGKFDISHFAAQTPVPTLPDLPQDGPRTVETITGEIIQLQRVGGEAVLGIGKRLIEAKAMLPHGEWSAWLAENFNYSERSAQRLMRLAREWTNPSALSDLGAAKALALLALPPDEREAFIAAPHDVGGGEKTVIDMTTRELQRALDARTQEAAQLRRENRELRERPVDVAVMAADEEALAKARAEGAEAAREEEAARRCSLEAEVAALRSKLAEAARPTEAAPALNRDEADFNAILARVREDVNRLQGLFLRALGRDDELADRFAADLDRLADDIWDACNDPAEGG